MTTNKLDTDELLFNSASQMGLQPAWLSAGGPFAITTTDGERYLNYAKSTVNSHLSSSMTSNKLITRLVLERNGLPGIPHLNPSDHAEAEAFLTTYKKIIIKPLTGSNSRDVHIIEVPGQLTSFSVQQYILEEYVAGKELRYLILDGQVIGVHESQYGESVAEDRELKRISYPRADWDPELTRLSLEVARIFGLRYAAVDYLIGSDGRARILEVNSSPGMKWFHAPTSGPAIDLAGMFLTAMLAEHSLRAVPTDSELPGIQPKLAYS